MGRKSTRLELTLVQEAEARRCLLNSTDYRERERLQFVLLAASDRHTLEDLAREVERSRSTIQNWVAKFVAGGLPGLLERDTPPGSDSPVAHPAVQAQLEAGLKAGRWKSAAEVAVWLRREHGIRRTRKAVYYWLRKNGWAAPQAGRRI